jgi:hypothetical protein
MKTGKPRGARLFVNYGGFSIERGTTNETGKPRDARGRSATYRASCSRLRRSLIEARRYARASHAPPGAIGVAEATKVNASASPLSVPPCGFSAKRPHGGCSPERTHGGPVPERPRAELRASVFAWDGQISEVVSPHLPAATAGRAPQGRARRRLPRFLWTVRKHPEKTNPNDQLISVVRQ